MLARLIPALFALTVSAPPAAADPAAVPGAESPPATEAAVTGTPEPAAPQSAAAVDAPGAAPAPAAAQPADPTVIGTRVLFLRLTLRIKRVEQELLEMSPERLLEHMGEASELLEQLRSRGLDENDTARADRMEEYLQSLSESYVELHTGKASGKQKKLRR